MSPINKINTAPLILLYTFNSNECFETVQYEIFIHIIYFNKP